MTQNLAQIQAEIAQDGPKSPKYGLKRPKSVNFSLHEASRGFILPYMTQIAQIQAEKAQNRPKYGLKRPISPFKRLHF